MKKWKKTFSRILNVCIIFLAAICVILFFKIVTNSEVSIGGIRFYYVATDSMYPTIKPNSMMLVKQTDPEKLKEGDIISFVSRDPAIYGMVNTHRIYQITEDKEKNSLAFVTMGDHNPTPDSLLVYPDEIKGKVIFHTPPIKALADFLSFAATRTGFFIVILMPLMLVAAFFLGSFMKEMRASLQQETEELEQLIEKYKNQEENQDLDQRLDQNPEQRQIQNAEPVSTDTGVSRSEAQMLLEAYFGKSFAEITENDISEKLEQMDAEQIDKQTDKQIDTEQKKLEQIDPEQTKSEQINSEQTDPESSQTRSEKEQADGK